jgi:phosphoglycerate dehydrogenase-like enzyme
VKVVVDLQDRRPVWAMPAWVPDRIRGALPGGAELVVIEAASDGSGDGSARVDPHVLAEVADADVYMGYGIPAEVLRRGARLAWVHSGAAGVGGSLTPEMLASDVVFTNSAGVHASPIAETVLGMILHFARGLDLAARAQARGRWEASAFLDGAAPIVELGRSTVGVVGFGGIGRAVAGRAAALGARVFALRRTPQGTGEVPLRAPAEGARRAPVVGTATVASGPEGLAALLRRSDFVVLAAPGTAETRAMIDRGALARMKPTAVLVNVSRGALVDEAALYESLASGKLRGAALDVFAVEPLPDGHPLWSLPNVLITPHVSAVTRAFWEREVDLVTENLRRFQAGEPLRNQVDKRAGY